MSSEESPCAKIFCKYTGTQLLSFPPFLCRSYHLPCLNTVKGPPCSFWDWADKNPEIRVTAHNAISLNLNQLTPCLYAIRHSENVSQSWISKRMHVLMTCRLAFKQRTRIFHTTGSSRSLLTSSLNVCVSHIHFLILTEGKFQKRGTSVKEDRKGKEEIEIWSLGFLPSSLQPRILLFYSSPHPPSSPSRPFPQPQEGGGGAAAWSRHLLRRGKAPGVTYPGGWEWLIFAGSFLDPAAGAEGGGLWPRARWRRHSRSREWLRTAVAGAWVGLRCPLHPGRPQPPPAGGIQSLAVAKGGEKASAEVPEKPRRCWNPAWGSWKLSSASSLFSGPRGRKRLGLQFCWFGEWVLQNL